MPVAVVTGAGRGFGREIAKRLARRGYAVLVTDIDEQSAAATAEELGAGAWAMAQDVRDAGSHREVAQAAAERGPLAVWVNNAGVLRTDKAWMHPDEDVRLMCEANLLGVIWGSRAAVDAMGGQSSDGRPRHVINLASMSAFGPVPGLAIYGATKHGVLGFTASLQGDLNDAGIDIRAHAVCPDAADTGMVREHTDDPEADLLWSGPRLLSPEEVAEQVVGLLESRRLVLTIPRWRAGVARFSGLAPRVGLALVRPIRWVAERRRRRQ